MSAPAVTSSLEQVLDRVEETFALLDASADAILPLGQMADLMHVLSSLVPTAVGRARLALAEGGDAELAVMGVRGTIGLVEAVFASQVASFGGQPLPSAEARGLAYSARILCRSLRAELDQAEGERSLRQDAA